MLLFSRYSEGSRKMARSYTAKYCILFAIKMALIGLYQSHRSKYYLQSFLIEAAIIGVCLFFDFSGNRNVRMG